MTNWAILTALITAAFPFLKLANYKPEERYKQWYFPFVLFIEAVLLIYFYNKYTQEIYRLVESFNYAPLLTYIEYEVVIVGMAIMLSTKQVLKSINLYDRLAKWIPGLLSNSSKYNDSFYYFPYVKRPMGARPGVGYLAMFFISAAVVCLTLIALSLSMGFSFLFYIKSGFFALCIPLFIEFHNFYNTSLKYNEDEDSLTGASEYTPSKSRFYTLWDEYTDLFKGNYNIAFTSCNDSDPQSIQTQNDHAFNILLQEFKAGKDLIIEDLDIPSSFHRLSDLFFSALSNGGNILMLTDITDRLNTKVEGKDVSMMELFTHHLSDYLQKNVAASNEILKICYLPHKAGSDHFKSRIILSSVSTILESDMTRIEWFSNLDLLLVFSHTDQGRVNFFENQKFNLLIKQNNNNFQTVILSPYRQGLQASLTRIWKLNRTHEKRLNPVFQSKRQLAIFSNFERWHENWLTMATPLGINLYSGTELSIPAIHYGIDPVTYLEVDQAEVREGREALSISRNHITRYDLSKQNIDCIIQMNLLPFFMFPSTDEHFSIIYDVENNAPAIYRKWVHLGTEENFSIVISKPYLFRDYFADNIHLFKRAPMLAIEPVPSRSKVNLAILLYNLLSEGKVPEKQIKRILNDYDISLTHQSTPVFLRDLFIRYFNYDIEENARLQVEETVIFRKDGYHKSHLYALAPFKVDHFPQFAPFQTVRIIDNRGIIRFTILKDMLFQNYLVGQKHVFNGRTFEVASFDENEGVMTIHNLPQFNNNLFYSSCFRVRHASDGLTGTLVGTTSFNSLLSRFSLIQFENTIHLETLSYYEFRRVYGAITPSNMHEVVCINLSPKEQEMTKRNYLNGRIMKLEWHLQDAFKEQIPFIQAGIHLLLFESFKSFFPYHNQYLIICSDQSNLPDSMKKEEAQLPWIFPEFTNRNAADCIEIFILEDSISDMGLLNAIKENYVYIFQYIYDYLCWLQVPDTNTSHWTFTRFKNGITDKACFLKYGFEEPLSFLQTDVLKSFADIHFPLDQVTKTELERARTV